MRIRLFPIIISLTVTAVVLFGGWFIYDTVAMENPLTAIVQDSPGVTEAHVQVNKDEVAVHVRLSPDASLREIYRNVAQQGASIIGKRKLAMHIMNESTENIEAMWSKALFEVAQAMETKMYSDIPAALERTTGDYPGLVSTTEMDLNHVYVRITDGEHAKFVVLPRTPAQMGVWTYE